DRLPRQRVSRLTIFRPRRAPFRHQRARRPERSAMSLPSATGPVGYLAAFVSLLQRLEITTASGSMPIDAGIAQLVELIASLKTSGGKAFLIGNGGSAADVSHKPKELCQKVGLRPNAFQDVPPTT